MARPHVDEITGADRVSVEEPDDTLPHLPEDNDGVTHDLPDGWERAETRETKITYYISHIDGQTYWYHPHMIKLIEKFESFNEIKYAAYRTALKLRAIQKLTHLSGVQLSVVKKALMQHGLTESHNNMIISVIEMEAILATMFNSAKMAWSNINPDYCTEVTLNWILACYDSGYTGKIKVVQLKIALSTLCSSSLEEKYLYYFDQISQEGYVNRNILIHFIRDIILIPGQLQEDSSFLNNDETAAATSCFQFNGGHQSVRGNTFVSWMMKEPKFIVWLPTMYRMAASETVKHEAKCGVCKMYPIVGMRFRSLKDFNTDFCQACFFSQKTTRNHKITHPVKEYSFATTTRDDVKDFAKVVRNKISKRHRHHRKDGFLKYVSKDKSDEEPVSPLQTVHDRISQLAERLADDDDDDEPDAPPMLVTIEDERLNREIAILEEENRQLSEEIASLKKMALTNQEGNEELTAKLEIKQEYTKRLEDEINQLRILLERQQQQQLLQQRPPSSVSGSMSPRDFNILTGTEENEIDLLVQQMLQAFPTGQEPGIPVYIHDEMYQQMMTVSNAAAALVQDVVTCYT